MKFIEASIDCNFEEQKEWAIVLSKYAGKICFGHDIIDSVRCFTIQAHFTAFQIHLANIYLYLPPNRWNLAIDICRLTEWFCLS